jgi:hypothetical protein
MGAALGLIGPLMSIGGSLFGGGSTASNVPQAPPGYQPTGQAQADQSFQAGVQGQQGAVPQANQAVQYLYNNPGAPGAMQGANIAGGLGEAAGLGQFAQGQNLTNTGNSVVPYAYSALNAGFDPQQSVYNQQFQQNTDQTRALLEARGIDSTPYGAGVEGQSNLNFNNAWLQNTLARQGQGAQTANSLFGTQSNDVLQGQNLAGQAPGTFMQGASMPYNTAQTIGTNQLGALGQGQGIQQTPLNNWMQYLQLGQGATGVAQNQERLNLAQNQQGWNQNQQLGQNLGAGLQGLSKGATNFQNNTPSWLTNAAFPSSGVGL